MILEESMKAEINKQCPKVATKKGLIYFDPHKKEHDILVMVCTCCRGRCRQHAWRG